MAAPGPEVSMLHALVFGSASETKLERALRRTALGFACAAMVSVVVAVATILVFAAGSPRFLSRSDSIGEWASFATLMAFVVQTILGGATLALAALLSGVFTEKMEARRAKEQQEREALLLREQQAREASLQREKQDRELVRLSEKMVDVEFYTKVMYPAWEVALKWMDPTFPKLAEYRADVVGAEFRLPKNYRRRPDRLSLAENNPRTHPHYRPYDAPHEKGVPAPVVNEMSESLAFATWVRFWRNVKYLIDQGIIDATRARHLFREWYMWWAPFMTEFVGVCEEMMARLERKYGFLPNAESWRESSIIKIRELHADFQINPWCGHADEAAFVKRVSAICDEIEGEFYAAIDDDRNDHVDGQIDPTRIVPSAAAPVRAGQQKPRGVTTSKRPRAKT